MNKTGIFLEKIVAALPGNIYWKNKDGICLGCNDNVAKILGLNHPDEIIGKSDYDLLDKDMADVISQNDKQVVTFGKEMIFEEEGVSINKSKAIYLTRKVPIFEGDEVIGLVGISFDITESKNEMQQIFDNVPANIYWLNKDGIFLGCNVHQLDMLGLKSTKEYVGKTYEDLYEKTHIAIIKERDKKIMQQDRVVTLEETAIKEDGSKEYFLTTKTPLHDSNGNVTGLIGVSLNITEKKLAENALKEAKIKSKVQEERINTMKATAAGIAHELRTPIRSIMASAKGIEKFLPILLNSHETARNAGLDIEPIYPQHEKLLRDAINRLEHEGIAANTVVDMLLMNIREIDVDESKFEVLSIGNCVDTALHRYPFQQKERRLINWDKNNDFRFKGNETLVVHILFNLMKNALYYIARAGKGEIFILLKKGKKGNQLIFKDTGTGISADILPHIFDKFFTKTEHGTGIGLSFCKMAMQRMNGNIACTSVEGEFTEFCLSFPVNN
ncbi:MAG: PAS domain-containing protein [Gammaproteobacteria bacterium]|jgi:PAS domain S-box-containing protein